MKIEIRTQIAKITAEWIQEFQKLAKGFVKEAAHA